MKHELLNCNFSLNHLYIQLKNQIKKSIMTHKIKIHTLYVRCDSHLSQLSLI